MPKANVAIVGCGGIALANHLPGLGLCPEAKVVAVCDSDPAVLERARQQVGCNIASTDFKEVVTRDEVTAVIIATPNFTHAPIALAAIAAGKHVLCEKPIAMDVTEARMMYDAARKAKVRHMTAFTYRFVPAMRYMAHLVKTGDIGQPYHFRSCRLQDWGTRGLGWRQVKKLAATGELGDMLSHRIDYAHLLVGQFSRVIASQRRFHDQRDGKVSDLEDWIGMLGDFENGASGVLESSKVATGRGEGGKSQDYCEVNGSEGTLVYQLERPLELQIGKRGRAGLETVAVPNEFLVWPGSKRDPKAGDPLVVFRYDQDVEFIQAILEQRDCVPGFGEGLQVQAVMEAMLESMEKEKWVKVERTDG